MPTKKNITTAQKKAIDFMENETQFQLGMLPTEQSNPKTKELDEMFAKSVEAGIKMLFSVDEDIVPMAARVLNSNEFSLMLEASHTAITNGGKIIFSGCGATGRLCILLEAMWRTFFRKLAEKQPKIFTKLAKFENRISSIMTGGDYALIQSVESFEDYSQFGQRQAQDLNICAKDVLIAITEGGETSSVLGTITEAVRVGAKPFLLFNNPADILCKHIERSRKAIEDPAVTILDLYCGSMAIAGSTRMQATSSEQLIAGAMLEQLSDRILQENLTVQELDLFPKSNINYATEMTAIINDLKSDDSLNAIAEYITFEETVYRHQALVTYFADDFLLDVFTDTTERAPTFMTPPFKKYDDLKKRPSWAFAKTVLYSTEAAWKHYLGRELRCLDWQQNDYIELDAPSHIINNPPAISKQEMLKFYIGNEVEAYRFSSAFSAATIILSGNEFKLETLHKILSHITPFSQRKILIIGSTPNLPNEALIIPGKVRKSNLNLMDHMKVKLTLNTISTGIMVKLGRVESNWMSFVSMSNKKLVDRSIRLISELASISYNDACFELFQSIEELELIDFSGKEIPSPVQYTLAKIRHTHNGTNSTVKIKGTLYEKN